MLAMKVKIEKHTLHIDVTELVEALSPQDKRTIARALCADEHLIKAVCEIAADTSESGYGHYFNDDEDGTWWFCSRTTLEIREKLLPLMPEVARQAVREALHQRDQALADEKRHSAWAWKMYHAWPQGYERARPDLGPVVIVPARPSGSKGDL